MAGQIIEGQEDFPIRRADFNRTEAAEAGRLHSCSYFLYPGSAILPLVKSLLLPSSSARVIKHYSVRFLLPLELTIPYRWRLLHVRCGLCPAPSPLSALSRPDRWPLDFLKGMLLCFES